MSKNSKEENTRISSKSELRVGDKTAIQASTLEPQKNKSVIQTLRGFKDVFGDDQHYVQWIQSKFEPIMRAYRFGRIDTPLLEPTALFQRSIGRATDIVEKEMFSFIDKSGDNVALRPEATASVVRAYIQHGMLNLPQPVRLWYSGPMFRHERPQSGRLRQFYQYGCEVIGDDQPMTDALLIHVAYECCKNLGLEPMVHINSIGCGTCRPQYVNDLTAYYRSRRSKMCMDCKKRLQRSPLRLLDCKDPGCVELQAEAPQLIDRLCDVCKNHFMRTLEYCDEFEIQYTLQPTLVRGLDYYTKTVFEIYEQGVAGTQDALAGGGRYDYLVELLGGRSTPAVGFAMGSERIVARLRSKGLKPPADEPPHIFIAQLGETARKKAIRLFQTLHKEGFRVAEAFSKDSLKQQLEIANSLKAMYTIIIGQKEVLEQTVLIRDMDGGAQEVVGFDYVVREMRAKLDVSRRVIVKELINEQPLTTEIKS